MGTWRKTVRILFVVHLMTAVGFNMVVPFLPLYIKQLGVRSGGGVAFWSGLIFALPALTMMLAAPLWGWLADRYGRKLMLVRSTLAGAVLLALMGFAQSVEHLALLRALQGALSGYIAASNALVSATIPRDKVGESFGYLRTGTWIGSGVGPLVGGLLGEVFGYRQSFFLTGGLLFCSGLIVVIGIRESFHPVGPGMRPGFMAAYRVILTAPGLIRIYSIRFVDSLGRAMILPMLPLFLAALMGGTAGVATAAGLLFGLRALAGSAASIWVGRLGDRLGHGKVVTLGAVGMVALYLPQAHVTASWQLIALQVTSGLVSVGVIPGIGALLSLYMPANGSGATFGLESSVDALARTVGPVLGALCVTWLGFQGLLYMVSLAFLVVVIMAVPLYRAVAPGRSGDAP